MLAAREQDFEAIRRQYEGVDDIILTIDGLRPEKGHETLYVVANLPRSVFGLLSRCSRQRPQRFNA